MGGIQGQISLREAVADDRRCQLHGSVVERTWIFRSLHESSTRFEDSWSSFFQECLSYFRYSDGQTNSKAKRLVWNWLRWRRRAALLLFCLGRRKMTRRLAAWSGELDLVETWSSAKIQNPAWHSVATSSFVACST